VYVTASPRLKVHQVKAKVDAEGKPGDQFQDGQPFRVPADVALDQNVATRAQAKLSWMDVEVDGQVQVAESPTMRSGDRFWYTKPDGTRLLVPRRTLDQWLKKRKESRDATQRGVHAEVAVAETLKSGWDQLPRAESLRTLGQEPVCWLQVNVTRSPCTGCAGAIKELLSFAASRGWTMKARVSAMSLFHVDMDPSEGKAGIAALIGAGIDVSVLRMTQKQEEDLAKSDPKRAEMLEAKADTLEIAIERAKKEAEVKLGGGG
jgi:hypothetical protein